MDGQGDLGSTSHIVDPVTWVAVKELTISYNNKEAPFFTVYCVYRCYGSLT